MDIAIIGGGIAGLTAALSLDAAGFRPTVYEAVADPRPLGVGINLLPHAVRELAELGLLDDLRKIGVEIEKLVYLMRDGRQVWRESRGLPAGYRWPQIAVHRGKLQQFLLGKVRERLGPQAVRLGLGLEGLTEGRSGRHRARLVDSGSGTTAVTLEPDLLIGADGIHSAVRRHFHPGEGLPKWNGVTLWRSTTRMKAVDIEPTMIWAGYPDQKFVAYPIHLDRVRDEAVLNWICELRSADPGAAPPEDWNRMADRAEFAPRFAHWRWQGLDVPAIIETSEAIGVFPMTDRDPLPRWSFGRATLIGDAAHPMYPIGSNGATQAIIDARVLAYHLAGHGEVEAALADYETERRPATAQIVLANRAQGPDRVLDLAEQRAADPAIDLDNALPIEEREAIAAQYKSVAGFAPAELNARASYSPVGPRVR